MILANIYLRYPNKNCVKSITKERERYWWDINHVSTFLLIFLVHNNTMLPQTSVIGNRTGEAKMGHLKLQERPSSRCRGIEDNLLGNIGPHDFEISIKRKLGTWNHGSDKLESTQIQRQV